VWKSKPPQGLGTRSEERTGDRSGEGVPMADPPRLRSNSGSREAILLASSRSVDPPPFAEEEIWRRLQFSTLGVAAGTAAVLTHRAASASGTLIRKAFSLTALKWGAVVAVVAAALGVAVPAASRSVRGSSRSSASTSALTVESDMLAAARAKLAEGDPRGALAEIARLSSQFPRGGLLEEREVVAIDSLGAMGDNEGARVRSAAFVRQFPASPYAAHLRRILEP